jgi:hypothetical protein
MPVRKDKEGRWHAEVCIDGQRLHRILPKGAGKKDAERREARAKEGGGTNRIYAKIRHSPKLWPCIWFTPTLCAAQKPQRSMRLAWPRMLLGKKASEASDAVIAMQRDLPHLKPATLNRSIGTLKKALTIAWEDKIIPINYGEWIKRLKENNQREVYLSIDQVEAIANQASDSVKAAIWIAIYTGMRRGEILKLQPEHIRQRAD